MACQKNIWKYCIFAAPVKKCQHFNSGTLYAERQVQNCLTIKELYIMSNVKVTPLHDRVIVEAAAAEEKTSSGIIIPDTAKEKPQRGKIVAVGNGKKDEPMTVKVGDTVLYGKYSGTEVQIDGKDYLIMRESDIFAVI